MAKQVKLRISADLDWTAEFLRELADEIETRTYHLDEYESGHGIATIEWPEE